MSGVTIEALPGNMRKVTGGEISADGLDALVLRAENQQQHVNIAETSRLTEKGKHHEASHAGESEQQKADREESLRKSGTEIVQDGGLVQRPVKGSSDPRVATVKEAPEVDNPAEPADQQTVHGKPATPMAKEAAKSR